MTKANTLEEALGVEGTLVMPRAAMQKYAFARKLAHPKLQTALLNHQLENLRGIVIHNAKTEQEVREFLSDARLGPVEFRPPKSNEAHFYTPATGLIHAVNPRGITRLKRDEALAIALQHVLPQDIDVDISNYNNHRRTANDRFEMFAFRLVDDIFSNLDMGMVASNGRVNLLFGPHASLDSAIAANGYKVAHESRSDYLNYRIFVVPALGRPEVVINFDYIFADQAKDVLHKFYKGIAAEFSRDSVDINLLHYGKVGLLDPATEIGDIVIPTGAIDEEKLHYSVRHGQPIPPNYPLKNQLETNPGVRRIFYGANGRSTRIRTGLTVNTISVLGQTFEGLQIDLNAGGISLDMEWIVMASLDAGSESTYPGIGTIRYFFAGVGSDKPLEGKTLGDTDYPVDVEKKVAASFIELVRNFPALYGR